MKSPAKPAMKYTAKRRFLWLFVVSSAFVFFACSRNRTIVLDESDPLSLMPGVEWAVVKEPYAAFQNESTYESDVVDRGRKGDVLCVLGKTYVKTKKDNKTVTEVWYRFEQGWLNQDIVVLYDNKLKAQTASRELLE